MHICGNPYAADFSTNRSRGKDWIEKRYQMTTRQFKNGGVEVTTHVVNQQQQLKYEAMRMLGGPPRRKRMQEVLTPEELARREKESLERAIRRAKKQVRFHVKSMAADHLLTLTYRSPDGMPMNDIERLKKDWKRFVRLVRKGLPALGTHPAHSGVPEWSFVAVPEVQKNGAYHLHIAVAGRQDIGYIRRCWYVALGGRQDDSGIDTLGQVNVRGPSNRQNPVYAKWEANKIPGYMTKYLNKTFEVSGVKRGGKRYWVGHIKNKPIVTKQWLESNSFNEALVDTFKVLVELSPEPGMSIWKSEDLKCIWMAGAGS